MSNYKMRIAVDFGSTVSALAWNLLEQKSPNAGFSPVAGTGWRMQFPTIIVEKAQNPAAPFDSTLYGEDALAVLKELPGVKTHTEFKHGLYDPTDEGFQESCRLTILFLGYLRGFLECNHDLSDELFRAAEKEVWYTTPLISAYDSNQLMQNLLMAAGFTPENGYGQFRKLDEATSLSSLALSSNNALFQRAIRKSVKDPHRKELALFIDIGGLTADINLVFFYYGVGASGEWAVQWQQLGCWPEPSNRKKTATALCGGLALDQALCHYLMENRFVNPEVVQESLEQRGYLDFREFKEQSNDLYWRVGGTRDTLDGLGADSDRDLLPKADYEKSTGKRLTPERFMTEVASEYIETLTNAIRSVIKNGAAHEAAEGMDVREETIDWIFLTGGGSNIFFLRPMLRGRLPQDLPTLNLEKIKQQPARILPDDLDTALLDHTMNCVNGALCYTGDFIASSPADYQIMIRFIALDGENQTVIQEKAIPLMTKQEILPVERSGEFAFTYHYTSGLKGIQCELVLLQGGEENITAVGSAVDTSIASKTGQAVAKDSMAKTGRGVVKTVARTLPAAVPAVAAIIFAAVTQQGPPPEAVNTLKNAFLAKRYEINREIESAQETLNNTANRITSDGDDTMHVSYRFSVDEERHITCQLVTKSKSFTKDAVPTHMDFI